MVIKNKRNIKKTDKTKDCLQLDNDNMEYRLQHIVKTKIKSRNIESCFITNSKLCF